MPLRECNIEQLKAAMEDYPEAAFYAVCRKPLFIQGLKVIQSFWPNDRLHRAYHRGEIDWIEYIIEYKAQITADVKAKAWISKIRSLAKSQAVFLVCVCCREEEERCHRLILLELIGGL